MLSNDLGWANHIDEICAKAMRRLDVIQSFKFKLEVEMHLNAFTCPLYFPFWNMVMSCGRDHLTAIWKNLTKSIYAQWRIITGATERSNINSMYMYEDLGWVSLSPSPHSYTRLTLFL